MKDGPSLESWLFIHLVLDLAVNLSSALLNVEGVSLSTSLGSHHHVTSLELVSFELSRVVLEFQMPELLLLDTLGMRVEDFQEILAFSYFPVSIGVDYFGKILHESEITSHRIGETSDLAEFRD